MPDTPEEEELRSMEEQSRDAQTTDWWEVRDGAVHLKRMPIKDERLPEVEVPSPSLRGRLHVGGGRILPVYGPGDELLSYGRDTE